MKTAGQREGEHRRAGPAARAGNSRTVLGQFRLGQTLPSSAAAAAAAGCKERLKCEVEVQKKRWLAEKEGSVAAGASTQQQQQQQQGGLLWLHNNSGKLPFMLQPQDTLWLCVTPARPNTVLLTFSILRDEQRKANNSQRQKEKPAHGKSLLVEGRGEEGEERCQCVATTGRKLRRFGTVVVFTGGGRTQYGKQRKDKRDLAMYATLDWVRGQGRWGNWFGSGRWKKTLGTSRWRLRPSARVRRRELPTHPTARKKKN